jgi:DNA-binding protein H-NS
MDLSIKTETELTVMIGDAEKALQTRWAERRQSVMAQIRELAASIGATVTFGILKPAQSGKGSKVQVKYRDGKGNTWTGRGEKPKWLREALEAGRSVEEFAV